MFNVWGLDQERWGFEITQGLYEGVVVQVEDIKLDQIDQGGQVHVDYHVISIPAHMTDTDMAGDGFQTTMNEVINKFLMDAIQDYEQNRNNNT